VGVGDGVDVALGVTLGRLASARPRSVTLADAPSASSQAAAPPNLTPAMDSALGMTCVTLARK
jgi:hypothetical protein